MTGYIKRKEKPLSTLHRCDRSNLSQDIIFIRNWFLSQMEACIYSQTSACVDNQQKSAKEDPVSLLPCQIVGNKFCELS